MSQGLHNKTDEHELLLRCKAMRVEDISKFTREEILKLCAWNKYTLPVVEPSSSTASTHAGIILADYSITSTTRPWSSGSSRCLTQAER